MSRSSTGISIVDLEKEIQGFWAETVVFLRTLAKTADGTPFTFYDGPPFATGLPHYGHILAGSIKDAVTRYQTMQGRYVERRFGWDCHGVPIEHIIEKRAKEENLPIDRKTLGGRANFNEQCRATVLKYTSEWRKAQNRIGRFIDMDNDYKTMNPEFMESVWWVFKQLFDKGLVYRGKKVVAYSGGLGTPLSDFEAKESYKIVQVPDVVVAFSLADAPDTKLLAWTTTPWSLPTNVGIAINKTISYVKVTTTDDHHFILSEKSLSKHFKQDKIAHVEPYDVTLLIGKKYIPLFSTVNPDEQQQAFTIVHSDHVIDGTDGTAVVQLSPAFGEDDYALGEKYQLPTLDFFDSECRFQSIPHFEASDEEIAFFSQLQGVDFKTADKTIIAFMQSQGMLFSHGSFTREDPFCYRTDKPLMNRAISCWFVAVTKIKDQMLKNNAMIHWYPGPIGEKRFVEWIKSAKDWNISRNRYWGTPLPIWENIADPTDLIVIDSRETLRQLSGATLKDLHSHFVDPIEIIQNGKTYRRVTEVFDCWFESGSMPYAQAHYPFEHQDDFHGTRFPANFIAEGLDQTRGWFYTLLIISTALFDKPPFLNCIVNGILLGNDGKKMSKSKGNYPSLDLVLDEHGADALRFVLLGSKATHAEPLAVKDELFHMAAKNLLIPIMNLHKFFMESKSNYPVSSDISAYPTKPLNNPLNQWLVWRAENFKAAITNGFENYNLVSICRELENFVADFSKWYIRNIKFFLKQGDSETHAQSLQCMHFALETLSQCAAPVIPFMSEYIYRQLFGMENSVHLSDWPQALPNELMNTFNDSAKEIEMVRKIVELAYVLRDRNNQPLRQPLPLMHLPNELKTVLCHHESLLCRAINVEEIEWLPTQECFNQVIALNHSIIVPKLTDKKIIKSIADALTKNDYVLSPDQETLNVCGMTLSKSSGDFSIRATLKNTEAGLFSAIESDYWVTLDTRVTPELREKASLRALEREIMKLRRELALTALDEIGIVLSDTLLSLALKYKTDFCKNTHATLLHEKLERTPNTTISINALNKEIELNGNISVYCREPVFSRLKGSATSLWKVSSTTQKETDELQTSANLNL